MSMTSHEIRKTFLDYFKQRNHVVVPSSPLIPAGDPTLLFVNSGMVQFKDTFLGLEKRPYSRATTAQKCLRVSGKHNDLEEVGPSPRHDTFFEMLGNFSFGDYFKKDAIQYAWDLIVNVYKLDPARLWFTVFEGDSEIPADDEAAELWVKVGAPPERVRRFGRKDNFWQMGETGPCGPNSEIHYYLGERPKDPKHNRAEYVNGEGDEQVEIWNLVFMQFNRYKVADNSYQLDPLPKPSVDTGAGLERLASVLQNKFSIYETDLFKPIIERTRKLLGHDEATMQQKIVSYRVIADHSRAIAFLIADGILPGNEGRNYVLRMILRRAARFGHLLGFTGPFLTDVLPTVIEIMGDVYPELVTRRESIIKTTLQEEERFQSTLRTGSVLLDELIAEYKTKNAAMISGADAFKLYDTYGFPFELTRDIAKEHELTIDEPGFHAAMEEQSSRSRSSSAMGVSEKGTENYRRVKDELIASKSLAASGVAYDPYSTTQVETNIAAILRDGALVSQAQAGDEIEIVLPKTCFYVESGGQVSDTGRLVSSDWEIQITDTRAPVPGLVLHIGKVVQGAPRVGDKVVAEVDRLRRWDIMRNHTATHLLHYQLRSILGKHVQQAGSLVAPDRFRFDFSHTGIVTPDELNAIEQAVNDHILAAYPAGATEMSYKDALATGAMALFTEKYGERVRVMRIGNDNSQFSKELCGGTHVTNTSQIGAFHILSESGIGSGIRRVEAVTGRAAVKLLQEGLGRLDRTAAYLNVSSDQVDARVLSLVDENQSLQKEIEHLRRETAKRDIESLLQQVRDVRGVSVLAAQVEATNEDMLREMSDWLREKMGTGIVVLGAAFDGRPSLIAAITPDLVAKGYDAVKLIRQVARVIGGGGGGRPTLAQAGGKDVTRLSEALELVPQLLTANQKE